LVGFGPAAVVGLVGLLLVGSSQFAGADSRKGEIVLLDPVFDAFVQTGTGVDVSGERELRLGTFDGSTVARSFLTFRVAEIAGEPVERAVLVLHTRHSWSCQEREWQVFSTGSADGRTRWAQQPQWRRPITATTLTSGYSAECAAGDVEVDITGLVREWAGRDEPEVTIGLRAADETDEFGWKKFDSAESGHPPRVRVVLA
jgi:hypothetical protein